MPFIAVSLKDRADVVQKFAQIKKLKEFLDIAVWLMHIKL